MSKKTIQNINNTIEDILNFKISVKCKNENKNNLSTL